MGGLSWVEERGVRKRLVQLGYGSACYGECNMGTSRADTERVI